MKPCKTMRESMRIEIHYFEVRLVFTDLVQLVKPYKTKRKVKTVSCVCIVPLTSLLVFMRVLWLHDLH